MEKGALVKVVWHDAADEEEHTWLKESLVDGFGDDLVVVTSVGYLLKQTKNYITLAGDCISEGVTETTWGRVTKIPLGMVQSIVELIGGSDEQRADRNNAED